MALFHIADVSGIVLTGLSHDLCLIGKFKANISSVDHELDLNVPGGVGRQRRPVGEDQFAGAGVTAVAGGTSRVQKIN